MEDQVHQGFGQGLSDEVQGADLEDQPSCMGADARELLTDEWEDLQGYARAVQVPGQPL